MAYKANVANHETKTPSTILISPTMIDPPIIVAIPRIIERIIPTINSTQANIFTFFPMLLNIFVSFQI